MPRTPPALALLALLGCNPHAPPVPSKKADDPAKPMAVTAKGIGPALEGKLVDHSGDTAGGSTAGWRKHFPDDT